MKFIQILVIFILLIPSGIAQMTIPLGSHLYDLDFRSLEKIVKDRYIRILTTNNSINYFLHKGEAKGVQYEIAKSFVQFLNKKYKLKPPLIQFEMIPAPKDNLMTLLMEGRGDLIAADLSYLENITPNVIFSSRIRNLKKVILVNTQYENGNKIVIPRSLRYSLLRELKISAAEVKYAPIDLSDQDLIELTSVGSFNAVVVDSLLAKYFTNQYSNLKILRSQEKNLLPSSWVARNDNKKLMDLVNEFLPTVVQGSFKGNLIKLNYKNSLMGIRFKGDKSLTNQISPYDNLLKKYGDRYGFDWPLLASIAFQESRFDQSRVNKSGAIGAFQVKESTAKEPYINIFPIKGKENLESNVHAGVKYLSWIKKTYFDPIPKMKERDRVRFTLAAYNAGPSRVLNAIKIAKKKNLNHNKWFRNVELSMIDLKIYEPVKYVSEINKRYVAYQLLSGN